MKIPKTKDGKHVLLFPELASANRLYRLRAAVEGRLMWESLSKLQQDPELVARLDDNYNNFFYAFDPSAYNPYDDPEKIFANVSIPLVARIRPNKQILLEGKGKIIKKEAGLRNPDGSSKIPEGDSFKRPYGSILYAGNPYPIWCQGDSPNSYMGASDKERKEYSEMTIKESNEIKNRFYQKKKLIEILSDTVLIEGLRKEALGYVRLSKKELARNPNTAFEMMDRNGYYFIEDETGPAIRFMASPKLREKIKVSANALIEEYLSEMR